MKNIFTPIAASVFALTASAQVTPEATKDAFSVYGVADAAYQSGTGSIANKTSLVSGSNMTSRLGFQGARSLNNGLTMGFVYEAQVNTDAGDGSPTNTNNQTTGTTTATAGTQGLVFARRATVSLTGSAGELRLGRDYTSQYRNRVEFDPLSNVGVGTSQVHAATIGGPVSTRASNIIAYFLPSNSLGVYGQIQQYFGEYVSNATTPNDGNGSSLRIGYKTGPFNISVSAANTSYAQSATTGDIGSSSIGMSYTHPLATLMAASYQDKVNTTNGQTATGSILGAIVPAGNGQFKIALSRYATDAAGNPESMKSAVGYVYNVMKDAVVYGTYAQVSNSGGAKTALGGAITAANQSSSAYEIGVRYSF